MNIKKARIFVVLGMHRSGTSALAGLLNKLGCHAPKTIMPATSENAKGYWESTEIYHAHEMLFSNVAYSWSDGRPFPVNETPTEVIDRFIEEMVDVLDKEYPVKNMAVIKDPRISLLLPIWKKIFDRLNIEPLYILSLRNPLEVSSSIAVRDVSQRSKAFLLWLRYMLEAEYETRGMNRCIISYDKLLRSREYVIDTILRTFDVDLSNSSSVEFDDDFVTESLRHHTFSSRELESSHNISIWVKDVYSAFKDLEVGEEKAVFEKLDFIRENLSSADLLYGTMLADSEVYIKKVQSRLDEYKSLISHKNNIIRRVLPAVSVIIVNYNGKKFLKGLLNSLDNQTLPPSEVVVVDNASSDNSVKYIKENFPHVVLVETARNLGFAGGNNTGVENAKGPLLVFINNDTVVHSGWLENLVKTWMMKTASGENVGAISPKIRYLNKFIKFTFKTHLVEKVNSDPRTLGVAVDIGSTGVIDVEYIKPIIVSGFYNEEHWDNGRIIRWTNGSGEIMLPVDEVFVNKTMQLRTNIKGLDKSGRTDLAIYCENTLLGKYEVGANFEEIILDIPYDLLVSATWVINNAGSRVDSYGIAGDIGINEPDIGQYDSPRVLDAFCGCSFLTTKRLYRELNGFDERFFMYYEDVDLSLRMRNKGYKIYYEPGSIVRHIHSGTSMEWSPLFRYHVLRNCRLNGLKNGDRHVIFVIITKLFIDYFIASIKLKKSVFFSKNHKLDDLSVSQIEYKSIYDAMVMLPKILVWRFSKYFGRDVKQ